MTSPTSRRRFIQFALAAAASRPSVAASPPRVIVFLHSFEASPEDDSFEFQQIVRRLAYQGFTDGRDVALELVVAIGGQGEELAREIARKAPRLVIARRADSALPMKRLAPDTPLVFYEIADPVSTQLVASFARPGGNATGVTNGGRDFFAKRFEILKELKPGARSLMAFYQAMSVEPKRIVANVEEYVARARAVGVDLMPRAVDNYRTGTFVDAISAARPDAFMSINVNLPPAAWVEVQARSGIPGLFFHDTVTKKGGLLSLGPDLAEQLERAADIAARILKGAQPAAIPVEQPTRLRLTINLAAARSLGLALPRSLVLRADRVIE